MPNTSKPIFIANWKMNLGLKETIELTKKITGDLKSFKGNTDIAICPSFTALAEVSKILKKSKIQLGAQDVFWEEKGAYTSNISAAMLKEIGCKYVIIGHSERRQYLHETDRMVHQKVKCVLEENLIPIICVGETFEERQQGNKDYTIIKQVSGALKGITLLKDQEIIIAYEPVWVIGSGQAVDPKEAEYTNQVIRRTLIDLFFPVEMLGKSIRIIYGGSVDSKVINEFVGEHTVDGVLVGGASLKEKEFVEMIKKIK